MPSEHKKVMEELRRFRDFALKRVKCMNTQQVNDLRGMLFQTATDCCEDSEYQIGYDEWRARNIFPIQKGTDQ